MNCTEQIKKRIHLLQEYMKIKHIDLLIVQSGDAHQSEFPQEHWKEREYISGFTGSAGIVLCTPHAAALFTDGRYFLQAEIQLQNSGIELMKMGLRETPSLFTYISQNIPKEAAIALDGMVASTDFVEDLLRDLYEKKHSVTLQFQEDIVAKIWTNRPKIQFHPIRRLEERYVGYSAEKKLDLLSKELDTHRCKSTLLSKPDDIAWLLNLRGSDIRHSPLFLAYFYFSTERKIIFLSKQNASEEIRNYLLQFGIEMMEYFSFIPFLDRSVQGERILLDKHQTSYSVSALLQKKNEAVWAKNIVERSKAIKTQKEIDNIKLAGRLDALALIRLSMWLERNLPLSKTITERDVQLKIDHLRRENPLCIDTSFETIAAYADNGALIHYSVSDETNAPIDNDSFLLVDSGGQYPYGTTDITRTFAVGDLTQEMKRNYTLVLKGLIALSGIKFPKGTSGHQLDVLARQYLWSEGKNYLHGTGHGIGYYLNVHEGPQSISTKPNNIPLEVGMVVSNEPGIYIEGCYGIRLENMMSVQLWKETETGYFYRFETLTYVPFDRRAIASELLSKQELEWINRYHADCYFAVEEALSLEEKEWLKLKTEKII